MVWEEEEIVNTPKGDPKKMYVILYMYMYMWPTCHMHSVRTIEIPPHRSSMAMPLQDLYKCTEYNYEK